MEPAIGGPAYRIVTNRLVIRCWQPVDVNMFMEAIEASLEHLRPWMPWAMEEPTSLATKVDRLRRFRGQFDLGQDFLFGIFNDKENEVLGGTGLHTRAGDNAREIGYWIHQAHINQGLATESTAALTKVAFEIEGVDRVEIHCSPDNLRSLAIPNKLGFQHEATLKRRTVDSTGQPRDTMIWSLFARDYPDSPASRSVIKAYDAAERRIL